jgi:hypothetical protein
MYAKLTKRHDSLVLTVRDGHHQLTFRIGRGGKRISSNVELSQGVVKNAWDRFLKFIATGTYGDRMDQLYFTALGCETVPQFVMKME